MNPAVLNEIQALGAQVHFHVCAERHRASEGGWTVQEEESWSVGDCLTVDLRSPAA